MSFIRRKRYTLDFSETELHGLTIIAKPCTFAEFIEIKKVQERDVKSWDDLRRDFVELAEYVVPHLVSWDLQDEDEQDVPLTIDEFVKQDRDFQKLVVNTYCAAISEVPRPLEKPSDSGPPSPAEELPMEVLSGSPPS